MVRVVHASYLTFLQVSHKNDVAGVESRNRNQSQYPIFTSYTTASRTGVSKGLRWSGPCFAKQSLDSLMARSREKPGSRSTWAAGIV